MKKYNYEKKDCFDKEKMSIVFTYKRRKSFMHFLVENGFEPLNNEMLIENEHPIFDTHDLNYHIMSFL